MFMRAAPRRDPVVAGSALASGAEPFEVLLEWVDVLEGAGFGDITAVEEHVNAERADLIPVAAVDQRE